MTQTRKPQFFRAERAEGRFDAIVVGSGMGGLAVAALLAKAGKKVLVLERHYTMGGFTHTFRRKNYEWDVGLHYVGEFHREGTLPNLLMRDIAGDRLRWAPLPDNYDRFIFPDRSYDFLAGRERFIAELARSFPDGRDALVEYVKQSDAAHAAAMGFFQHKALPAFLASLTRPFLCREFMKTAGETTAAALARLTDDPKLAGVLAGQWGTYGHPPAESSFGIHATVASHFFDGTSYPVGGSGSIAEAILPTIEAAFGTLLVDAEVAEILIRNGRACGVRMSGGEEIPAPLVISDAGVPNTFGRLIGEPARNRLGLEANLAQVRPSTAHICLYVGLGETAERLGIQATNLWIYPGYDHDRNVRESMVSPDAPLASAYISFPSAKDPTWNARRGETATLEMISFTPYEWFAAWEDKPWKKRGAAYDDLKARLSERLLEMLYEHVPQARGKVVYHELSTPLSTRHFSNYAHGEIYGLSITPDRFRLKWLVPRTPVRGLFLTGQDVAAHGIVGALFGGLVTAAAVLRRNVLKDVQRRAGRD